MTTGTGEILPGMAGGTITGGDVAGVGGGLRDAPMRDGTIALGSTQSGPLRSMHSGLESGRLAPRSLVCAETVSARFESNTRNDAQILVIGYFRKVTFQLDQISDSALIFSQS